LKGQVSSKIKKTMNSKLLVLKLAALCTTLSACHIDSEKPIDLSKNLAVKREVTVTEMEPDDQLSKALDAFVKGDYPKSSADMKEAAKSMRLIGKKESDQRRKEAIEKAAEALETESDKVAKHQVKDITLLYPSFGKTGRALAGNRLAVTEDEFFRHNEGKAGALLTNTVVHLEKSVTAHHRALTYGEKRVLTDALDVATRMEKGDKVDKVELTSAIQNVDAEIEKWNKEFEAL
jgi:hypothetical protein